MSTRIFMAMLVWLALVLPGAAQDEAEESGAEDAPQASEGQNTEAGEEESSEQRDIDEFTFSEEIPADTQLVFPVDI